MKSLHRFSAAAVLMMAVSLIGLSLIALSGCASLQAALDTATSASVTRNQAIQLAVATKTLQDIATTTMETCVETHSTSGICKPSAVDAVHKALVATRGPRDALLAFANEHAGKELGASGLYAALQTAKDQLLSVLAQYGVTLLPDTVSQQS